MPKIKYRDCKFTQGSLALIATANQIIEDYAAQGFDLTLRQLYYQFVARDVIRNKDTEYKRLGSIINDARLAGLVDWESVLRVQRRNATQILRHATEKPVALLQQLIESSSVAGEVVLDPCAGVGSTLVAALLEGRRSVGIELDEENCRETVKRVTQVGQWLEACPESRPLEAAS